MGAKMLQIKKKEEPKEEIIEEKEKEPIFENEESIFKQLQNQWKKNQYKKKLKLKEVVK